jgi:uncharacterized membrane protein YedE/YeeE
MTTDLWRALIGGLFIGLGAATLVLLNGKIAGISGILDSTVRGTFGPNAWRIAFLIGLIAPAAIFGVGSAQFASGLPMLAVSGILVGFGTRLGSGCTSGHGVCGLSNWSCRSLVATLSFMIWAVISVYVVRHGAVLWAS